MLARTHATVLEVLEGRGFVAQDKMPEELEQARIYDGARRDMWQRFCNRADPKDMLSVYWCGEYEMRVHTLRMYLDHMEQNGIYRAIIITSSRPSAYILATIQAMFPRYFFEIFTETELFNHHAAERLIESVARL